MYPVGFRITRTLTDYTIKLTSRPPNLTLLPSCAAETATKTAKPQKSIKPRLYQIPILSPFNLIGQLRDLGPQKRQRLTRNPSRAPQLEEYGNRL